MSSGMPSMTALLGMLVLSGYQNRDKLSELLKGGRTPIPLLVPALRPWGEFSGISEACLVARGLVVF